MAAETRRRTFGPVVLVGVLAGVAAAMAGTQSWFDGDGSKTSGQAGVGTELSMTLDGVDVPAVNALALLGLACWGVVLVSRGRFRQCVALLGGLSAAGAAVAAVNAWLTVPDDLRASFDALAMSDRGVSSTGWSWIGSTAVVLSLLAWVVAVPVVKGWPEMGRRYDTPSDTPPEDLWKAMDQGHDPTS